MRVVHDLSDAAANILNFEAYTSHSRNPHIGFLSNQLPSGFREDFLIGLMLLWGLRNKFFTFHNLIRVYLEN